MTASISTSLRYANLQMATESLFGIQIIDIPGKTSLTMDGESLKIGNNRASKFTETQAKQFLDDGWTVKEHKSNTGTGFSGTLFENSKTGELVLSFRSTEFIDDSARDNQATNSMEIKPFGWAFGQIADMESWYASLRSSGKIPAGVDVTVTGYSLGGHLATAFNLLRREDPLSGGAIIPIKATYTFNGAGVGQTLGVALSDVIKEFQRLRTEGSAGRFTYSDVVVQYEQLRNLVKGQAALADIENYKKAVQAMMSPLYQAGNLNSPNQSFLGKDKELKTLWDALDRVKLIVAEAARVPSLQSGGSGQGPANIPTSQIDSTKLDYQLAVLFAQERTKASAGVVGGGIQAVLGREQGPFTIPNFYDVYGDTTPSAVSNSQLHYGTATPIFIEDQPVLRGSVVTDALTATASAYWDVKLLVPNFNQSDFGDTHSLVLMQDALTVENMLAQLDSTLTPGKASELLRAASNKKADWQFGEQGKAEGDVLENVVKGLAKVLNMEIEPMSAKLEGNTWADVQDRTVLHENIKKLVDGQLFKALKEKVKLETAHNPLVARRDFLAFLSLKVGATFSARLRDGAAVPNALQSGALGQIYQAWNSDKALVEEGKEAEHFTNTYLNDRSTYLNRWVEVNVKNIKAASDSVLTLVQPATLNTDFIDYSDDRKISVRAGNGAPDANRIVFGDDKGNTLEGTEISRGDHLYGGSGNDTLSGQGGADHLEGNAGEDILNGGAGGDTLLGGAGNDTYRLQTASDGIDTIADTQGSNVIEVNGTTVKGAFSLVEGMGGDIYYSADKAYQLRPTVEGVWRLSAKNAATGQYAAVADIQGWKDGQFDLTLGAPNPKPDRVEELHPNSGAYLAFDGAAAPKGVYFAGGSRSDSFNGSAYSDVITTGDGTSNYVMAFSGDDMVVGGTGHDFIRTGGNGVSTTNTDNDIAFGGDDSDVLMGGSGDDQLWGGFDNGANAATGADSGDRGDWLSGELGNDILQGSHRSDVLFGGADEDVMNGGAGADLMLGDGRYTPFSKSTALQYAGSFTQSFVWNNDVGDMVKVSAGNYGLNPVTIASGRAFIWTWEASGFNDHALKAPVGLITNARLEANGGADVMDGGEGDDWMAGQTGNDVMYGGAGSDVMFGDDNATATTTADADAGLDLMYGDAGDDRMYGGAKGDVLDGGAGSDKLYGEAGNDLLLGGAGDDELSGDEGDDNLNGGEGADRLLGGDGSDNLQGDGGADMLEGGAGNDALHGGLALDQMQGGEGDDVYTFDVGDDAGFVSTATDSAGNNTVLLGGGSLSAMQLTGSGSDWTLRYSANDTVRLSGSFGITWAGKTYTTAEFVKAIADAAPVPPNPNPDPVNRAPTVTTPLADTSTRKGESWMYQVPGFTFADPDAGDTLVYSATLADGTALPAWVRFDAATRTFSGTAPTTAPTAPLGLKVTATDSGGLKASTGFTLAIGAGANSAPVAGQPLPAASVDEDTAWTYTVPAGAFSDPDAGDTLVYAATLANGSALPTWLQFDAATRTFSGTPANGDVASLAIALRATDPSGASAVQPLALQVRNVNDAPVLAAPLADASTRKGEAWTYQVPGTTFADPDAGDALAYSATLADGTALPAWLRFDAATRTFSGTAPATAPIAALGLRVTASDAGGLSASTGFALAIGAGANGAPVAGQPLPAASVDEDQAWTYTVPAAAFTDPDGDAMSYTATLANGSALPAWLQFDAATRTFSGTPGNADVATLAITLRATDAAGATAVQPLALQVRNVNDAPVAGLPLPPQQLKEGEAMSFTVPSGAFVDVDAGDSLALQAGLVGAPLPAWLRFEPATGTFSGSAPTGSAGALSIVVTATDRAGATASQNLQVVVAPATPAINNPPTVTAPPPNATATVNAAWKYTLPPGTFTDPEGQALSYKATQADGTALPTWVRFDAATRTFSGTPGSAAIGNLSIRVQATDPAGATANTVFALTVVPKPSATVNQVLQADDKNTPLVGGDGNDTLNGSWVSSTMYGGNGNDVLTASGGPRNLLDGGAGDDRITGGWGNDQLSGGEGNNTIRANGRSSVITAGAGNDSIYGSWGDDQIHAGHGNNRIQAGGGKNTVAAGDGDDTIYTMWGNDTIDAGNGNNTVDAGAGANRITTGLGNDVVSAQGVNTIATGAGNDQITTSWGADNIDAGAGNDIILAGGGGNTLRGGLGNDQFTSIDWSNDRYLFARGDGQDVVSDGGGQDVLVLEDVQSDQLWFQRVGNDLSVTVLGTPDAILLKKWYGTGNGNQFHLEQFKTSDGKTLLDGKVQSLVQAMSAFAPPAAGQTTLPAAYQTALAPVLAANWR